MQIQDAQRFGNRDLTDVRAALRVIQGYIGKDRSLRQKYSLSKRVRQHLRGYINIDLTNRCNLFCEGCFFFEGDDYKNAKEEMDAIKWRHFFKSRNEDGGNYIAFAGGEPALEQKRIVMAQDYMPNGLVVSNGTIRLSEEIRYNIHISVWGDEDHTARFRGGDVFWKALRNYGDDKRVRFVFTVNSQNSDQLDGVAKIIADHGALLSFNYYSPTEQYERKVHDGAANDGDYFRFSRPDDNLMFNDESLKRAGDAIERAIARYPDNVIHSSALNRISTVGDGLYDVDPRTGIATNCRGLNFGHAHRIFRADLKKSDAKCCVPNVDCRYCRLYAISLAALPFEEERFLASRGMFLDWLEICWQSARIHFPDSHPIWGELDPTRSKVLEPA